MRSSLYRSPTTSTLGVLIAVALLFELLGWLFVGQSFLANARRLNVMILQVSVIGIIAIGVTQVMIAGGIDLSGGSVAAFAGMVAASFAVSSGSHGAPFPQLADLPVIVPILVGLSIGALAGAISGSIVAFAGVPPFIPTLGMLVAGRALAVLYTAGKPIFGLEPSFTNIGAGIGPVVAFLAVAAIFHILLNHTLYGRYTYAVGSQEDAAILAGIDVKRHKVLVYAMAGMLSGFAGIVMCARSTMAEPSMGTLYELDAISAAVIGGTSLLGGRGRIAGTVIGVLLLGVLTSGLTFLRLDYFYQEIVKGMIIVAAVVFDQHRQERFV